MVLIYLHFLYLSSSPLCSLLFPSFPLSLFRPSLFLTFFYFPSFPFSSTLFFFFPLPFLHISPIPFPLLFLCRLCWNYKGKIPFCVMLCWKQSLSQGFSLLSLLTFLSPSHTSLLPFPPPPFSILLYPLLLCHSNPSSPQFFPSLHSIFLSFPLLSVHHS